MKTFKKDRYIIKSNRRMFIILFLVSALFVFGCAYIIQEFPAIELHIGFIFFGLGLIFTGAFLIFPPPALEINKEGFIDKTTFDSDALIPWTYVENIYIEKFKDKDFKKLKTGIAVEINSDDIESFFKSIENDYRLAAKKRIKNGQPPILIDISETNKKPKYVLDLMTQFLFDSVEQDDAASESIKPD